MKIHHLAIICSDYQVSKKFYTEILGLQILREVYRSERDSYKLDLGIGDQYVIELFSFSQSACKAVAAGKLRIAPLGFFC